MIVLSGLKRQKVIALACRLPRPESRQIFQPPDRFVSGDQNQILPHRLRNQQSIERIIMLPGQIAGRFRLNRQYRDRQEAVPLTTGPQGMPGRRVAVCPNEAA